MNDAPSYPVGTIFEMAAIPEEAFPRFLAELPDLIAYLRHMQAMNDMLIPEGVEVQLETPTWTDDDKRMANISISAGDEEIASMRIKMQPVSQYKQEKANG